MYLNDTYQTAITFVEFLKKNLVKLVLKIFCRIDAVNPQSKLVSFIEILEFMLITAILFTYSVYIFFNFENNTIISTLSYICIGVFSFNNILTLNTGYFYLG